MNIMTRHTALVTLLAGLTTTIAQAQDRLSPDEALRYAELVGTVQAELKGVPAATAVDLKQPVAVREGDYGLMVLPAVQLSEDVLAKAGADIVPVGQLWLHKLAPLAHGQVIAKDKLKLVTVSGGAGSATVPCCPLAVRKAADGRLELLVFGKGKDPIVTAPLNLSARRPGGPLDLEVERYSDRGQVTVKLAGKYAAVLEVTDPELF